MISEERSREEHTKKNIIKYKINKNTQQIVLRVERERLYLFFLAELQQIESECRVKGGKKKYFKSKKK